MNNIQDIITELDRISALNYRRRKLERNVDAAQVAWANEQDELHSKIYPALPKAPGTFSAIAQDPGIFDNSGAKKVKFCFLAFAALLVIHLILNAISKIYSFEGFVVVGILAFGIATIVCFSKFSSAKKEYDHKVNARNKFIDAAINAYPQERLQFNTDLDDFLAKYRLYEHRLEELNQDNAIKVAEIQTDLQQTYDDLNAVTLLAHDHIFLAEDIKDLLTSGRADTLKEALNLAIRENDEANHRARMLAEEEHRTKIAQQQAYENQLHNQKMEKEAAQQAQLAQAQLAATQAQTQKIQELIDKNNKGRR